MILLRKANERGLTKTNWLTSYHTFSFADYYDPDYTGFESLLVINDDIIQAGQGFGMHPHDNMEIITYVINGELEHKDSMGTGSVIKPGELQRMSAGSGVRHSEFNHSQTNPLHLLQIWIIPTHGNLKPGYQQITIPKTDNQLILIGSQDGRDGSITIHQKVDLFVAYLKQNNTVNHSFETEHNGWIQVVKGEIAMNGHRLMPGDGAAISHENRIHIESIEDTEFLLFDMKSAAA